MRTLVKRGFLSTFTSPALPPGKKLYAITRQGVVFLSQHVAVPVEGLTPVRGGIMATTINHHLAILRVRHALSCLPQVTWIPNRFVQRRFSKMKVNKIPEWFPEACSFRELDEIESLTLNELGELPYISATSGNYRTGREAGFLLVGN